MKRIGLLFLLITSCCILFAQDKDYLLADFLKKYGELESATSQAFAKKDYKLAKTYVDESIGLHARLSEKDKESAKQALAGNYYNLACLFSLEKNTKKAVESFTEAVELGYTNYGHAKADTDLDNIRNDKQFKKLVEDIRKLSDYKLILKQAGAYKTEDTTGYHKFVYEDITNARIQNVKTYLKLDSIAGNGDEVSKVINIMTWVHDNIRHNGSHWPICELDAIDIYNYAKVNSTLGVNCRALAIVLNECYLSMGFKSRFITCMPKSETDMDCHVINSVYLPSLNKWVWMDPTFNAYVKDENGNLLGIHEVRDRLIKDLPIVLNADANWNNINPQTKEYYIDSYMAKNLYWLQCTARSIFNVETGYRNTNEKYIVLSPQGYEIKNSRVDNFVTHDPDYFWQAPEL